MRRLLCNRRKAEWEGGGTCRTKRRRHRGEASGDGDPPPVTKILRGSHKNTIAKSEELSKI